jgi:GNAT superfamily N-acetyltransferase
MVVGSTPFRKQTWKLRDDEQRSIISPEYVGANIMTGSATRVTTRRAGLKDIPGIVDCLAAAFEPYRESYTPDGFRDTVPTVEDARRRLKEMTILIAEDGCSRIVGSLSYRVHGSCEGHLRGMAVIPEFQGTGVAERMLRAAEAALRELGCSRVTLDTTLPLKRATRFYMRHEYKATGITKDFYGMPLFEFEKTLDAGVT